MNEKIDLWQNYSHPKDFRCDTDQNAKLLNIVYQGGTFGNFLKFMLDKFSKLSPNIEVEPFSEIGTSHGWKIKFSGLIQRYHQSFINDNEGMTGLPICLILPSTKKHFLYLKKAQWYRGGDAKGSPDHLWQKTIGELKENTRSLLYPSFLNILKLYGVKESNSDHVPKFIIRDWYKLEFLKPLQKTYNYRWFDIFKQHDFFNHQKVFHLDLETFFKWESFVENIKVMDRVFGLHLDFDRIEEMKTLFKKGINLDPIRQECNLIEKALRFKTNESLINLDVSTEAYIYAEFEKRNPDIQMPLTNRFFRDTDEIRQFLEHFPNWYRRPNPNLPRK